MPNKPDVWRRNPAANAERNAPQRPLNTVRYCLWCSNGSAFEVAHCPTLSCPLWEYRFGRKPTQAMLVEAGDHKLHPLEDGITVAEFHDNGGTPLKAIKRCCLACAGSVKSEVRDCEHADCPLHPFRFGKNPNRAMAPEQRRVAADRLMSNLKRRLDGT
jgi:hypothetical protein